MIEEIRAHVAEKLQELDGVIGLRRTAEGTAPYVFREGDDVSQLELAPRYALASVVSSAVQATPKRYNRSGSTCSRLAISTNARASHPRATMPKRASG